VLVFRGSVPSFRRLSRPFVFNALMKSRLVAVRLPSSLLDAGLLRERVVRRWGVVALCGGSDANWSGLFRACRYLGRLSGRPWVRVYMDVRSDYRLLSSGCVR